jgi:hypothetical protein
MGVACLRCNSIPEYTRVDCRIPIVLLPLQSVLLSHSYAAHRVSSHQTSANDNSSAHSMMSHDTTTCSHKRLSACISISATKVVVVSSLNRCHRDPRLFFSYGSNLWTLMEYYDVFPRFLLLEYRVHYSVLSLGVLLQLHSYSLL